MRGGDAPGGLDARDAVHVDVHEHEIGVQRRRPARPPPRPTWPRPPPRSPATRRPRRAPPRGTAAGRRRSARDGCAGQPRSDPRSPPDRWHRLTARPGRWWQHPCWPRPTRRCGWRHASWPRGRGAPPSPGDGRRAPGESASFEKIELMCFSTARSDRTSEAAMAALFLPWAISAEDLPLARR